MFKKATPSLERIFSLYDINNLEKVHKKFLSDKYLQSISADCKHDR